MKLKMKERDAYRIPIHKELVDVAKEVYEAFYQGKRKIKTIWEKDQRNGVFSCDALDNGETVGGQAFEDLISPKLEDEVEKQLLIEKLRLALTQLTEPERKLIEALYFEGLSERRYATRVGKPYMTVHDQKVRILCKIKKILEN